MSGLFSTLNTANKGLFAQQTALHTTSHNIANANTKGYTRQRVEMKADFAYNLGGVGQLGTGVKMDSIVRLVDDYVTKQIRNEMGTLERYTAKSEVIDQLEVIFNEPSTTGLNFYLGEMFDSWQELSKNPESLTSKTVVVEKSKALADTINHMADQLQSLKDETIGQIEKNAMDFNSIVEKLESLNQQILNISITGQVPNDLLDQRDLMLQDLGNIADFKTDFDKYGRVSIKNGEIDLLGDNQDLYELSVVKDIVDNKDGTFNISISRGGNSLEPSVEFTVNDIDDYEVGQVIFTKSEVEPLTIDDIKTTNEIALDNGITSGKIKGNTEALEDISDSLKNLNQFANTMAKAVNAVHTGDDSIIHPGDNDVVNFFKFEGDKLKVNEEFKDHPDKVLAGKDYNSPEGDGSRALAIARLRNTKLDFNGATLTYDSATMSIDNFAGGTTIEGAYGNIVTNIGISKEHSDNKIANQEVLVGQLEIRRESTSGVSIDEEVSNVIKFQKAYEANARVISVLAEMLDVLINRTGV
ncbi:MAG: flagellar hook-associated protein FlgK [Tissierellaceae bacterium]|nr:flagellar hook-associated protein FlgK [Tissierellaceae bacterium]